MGNVGLHSWNDWYLYANSYTAFVAVLQLPSTWRYPELRLMLIALDSYFTPHCLDGVGTFQDGGLTYNNPASIAIRETAALFPTAPEPSIVVSLGTGYTRPEPGSELKVTTMWTAIWEKSFPSRLFRAFWKQGDSDAAWNHLISHPQKRGTGEYCRFDIGFESTPPALDDVHSMLSVARIAREAAFRSPDMERLAHRIRAELFLFELDALPRRLKNGAYYCEGHLICRLGSDTVEYETLISQLAQCSAWFQCQERPLPGRLPHADPMMNETHFYHAVTFQVSDRQDEFSITLNEGKFTSHISGSPFTLERLTLQQNLDAVFGRADHK